MFRDSVAQSVAASQFMPIGGGTLRKPALGRAVEAFNVLVVDDEPRLRNSFAELVAGAGYRQTTAGTGSEALACLRAKHFDLVLLDLNLPDMGGLQVMEAMAADRIATTVVVVSGDVGIDSAIAALRMGAYDFLRKPCEPEELLQTVGNAIDRTWLEGERRDINTRLQESERAYRYLVDNSPDIIYTLDQEGRFSFVNSRVEALLGFTREQLIGCHFSLLTHGDDVERVAKVLADLHAGRRAASHLELRLRRNGGAIPSGDGEFITVAVDSRRVYHHCPQTMAPLYQGIYGVARDISERKRAEETILFQAYHDALTGLPNRTLFKNRLDQALAQAKRNGCCLAVMFLDLDRFKLINDTLGHQCGDELLQEVAGRLERCVRKGDTLARVGGDEFMLLLPLLDQPAGAGAVAQKILDELRQPLLIGGQELVVSASIGISIFPDDGEGQELLIRNADIAMYHGKWHGRNAYRFYSKQMNEAFHEKLAMETDLRKAIERNEFVLHYQPQVDILQRKVVGMEALIRWQHPTRGLVSPGVFIPLAEETGLITRISAWVLEEVCKRIVRWRAAGLATVRVAVNIAAQEIEQPDFVENVAATLARHGVEPAALEIEITESAIMRDIENSVVKLEQLGQMGVMISVDDFGTRYSALNYLRKFPIHTIKIDQSFVRDLTGDDSGTPIVAAIVAIARGFDLNLIAEGVESRQQLEILHALDCVNMQGYLFSKPLSEDNATAVLADPEMLFHPMDASSDLLSADPINVLVTCRL